MLDEVSRGEWGSVTIIKRRKRKGEEWWACGHIKKEVEVEIPDDPAPTGAPTGSVLRRRPPEHCPFLAEKGGIRKKVASQTRMERDKRKSAEGARIQSDKEDWR